MSPHLLHSGFLRSSEATPDRPALYVDGVLLTYAELRHRATTIAATLQQRDSAGDLPLTAVFADRSRTGFAGILGALLAGDGYVPLNPDFPIERTRRMLQQAGCRSIVVDTRAEAQLDALLEGFEAPLLIMLPDRHSAEPLARRWLRHTFVAAQDMTPAGQWTPQPLSSDAIAYLLFTSGSTGIPKGVGVTHANVVHFVRTMVARYGVRSDDRFSQMFDTTFDLSVFDLFVAWHAGASVYCPPRAALINPDSFIREHALTIWFSVPTVGLLMKRLGALKPARYPSLRWSLFCGEALPVELAEAWATAAPASIVENLYGPTEVTVACTAYRWEPRRSPSEASDGLVPIGSPTSGMTARVVDQDLRVVAAGEAGELLMSGPQCTSGYWRDREATARAFVRLADESAVFYRTGDLVRQAGDGPLRYVGRIDHQIKVAGHRVELGEVESVLRQEPGVDQAVAVGWPTSGTGTAGVAAFVTGSDIDVAAIRAHLAAKLQAYAVPRTIHILSALPQNAHGKVDRQALLGLLTA